MLILKRTMQPELRRSLHLCPPRIVNASRNLQPHADGFADVPDCSDFLIRMFFGFHATTMEISRLKSHASLCIMFRIILLTTTLLFANSAIGLSDESPVDFATEIKPLLSDRCFLCHGPDAETRQADLRLDSVTGIKAPLSSDATLHAVVAGNPDASQLVARILSDDPDAQMPPPDSGLALNEREKSLLRRWVAEGAEWKGHWAFEPITSPEVPDVHPENQRYNAIDRFILNKLESRGMQQNGAASKERLIRRATFDITGLPPTLAEIDAFLADERPQAFEAVIDRLLALPQYGERMASDWLDVARYSDTYGYQVDRDRFVWPWRDWVVRAFNENKPYDEFIVEQLAGDLLPNATRDQILATTFNRLHPQKVEGGSVPEEFRVEYVADRAQTTATAFMGLTMECCRCHDHKYDPLSQREYYQFYAFFNNIDEAGLYSYFTDSVPTPTLRLPNEQQQAELEKRQMDVDAAAVHLQNLNSAIQNTDRGQQTLGLLFQEIASRLKDSAALIPGEIAKFDFETGSFGANKIIEGRDGKVVQLTGDHGIDVKVGNFPRWQPFSITTWMKTPKAFERSVVFHRSRAWTDAGSRGYELLIEDGHLSTALIHFWPGNAIGIRSVEPIPVSEWIHVALTYDGSSLASGLKLFLNGRQLPTEIVRDNLYKNITGGGGDNITIGERFRDIGFAGGQVDDFRVFDRRLTDIEIGQVFDGRRLANLLTIAPESWTDQQRTLLRDYAAATTDQEFKARLSDLQAAREALFRQQDGLQEIMVMQERPSPRKSWILARGAYDAHADEVFAEVPAALPSMPAGEAGNRLGLARWLTSNEHPLTARVAVNRLWQMLFGHGLVRTPEDFGSQGMVPSHPRLLDWLAADFRDHGWDVKRTLKQIMMSATYQQGSQTSEEVFRLDPANIWLARFPVYRLPAEMLRDNALYTSGLLQQQMGGPSVRPYELAASFKPSTPDKGAGLYRRSLYTYWKRTAPAPVMMTLDASSRDVCRVTRERTASPLQALVVMNGPQFVEASRVLADRLIKQHANNDEMILTDMFRMLTGRRPATSESEVLMKLMMEQQAHFTNNPDSAAAYLTVGESRIETDAPARLAAWASVANALYAFDECMIRR